ncbi:MAG TPA: flagellar basal body-associated FliL family protein [Steroidobacteraceae bacterium]|jgi:flagellar FliL protein|nr:flagellar basal body-associated FliL family protein [Steroidobacteraceae bacterium]
MADEDTEVLDEEFVEGEEGEVEGEEGAPKSRKLLFIIIAAVLLVGGGGAFFLLKGDHKAETKAAAPVLPPIYVNLDPPFVVNFEAESMVRFLQVTVSVMTRDPHVEEELKKNDPRIRNDLLMLLGNQKYDAISTREGKESLRAQSLDSVRAVVKSAGGEPEKVEALYFTAFVMQ